VAKVRVAGAVREMVEARALGCCEYCLTPVAYSPDPFSIDHVVPRSAGGPNDPENLAFSCQGCNGRKAAATRHVDPSTGETVPLFNPRLDRWSDHFKWADGTERVVPVTPVGRATVDRLQLNRPGLVKLRGALQKLGEQPRRPL
jgi:hypothetical protein